MNFKASAEKKFPSRQGYRWGWSSPQWAAVGAQPGPGWDGGTDGWRDGQKDGQALPTRPWAGMDPC